ncbi:MAG: BMP family ABC transporter substrate-binding protein, partial [Caldilineales bacterium]|nr:BMP family ABC transporter substrate-binding protein [Caldilineales bacterium]
MRKHLLPFILLAMGLALVLSACAGLTPTPAAPAATPTPEQAAPAKTIKACYVYVGPIGDLGWTHAHDVGRRYVDDRYDWLETTYVESVAESDSPRFIDRFVVEEKCNVVFTTSFGYMDDTLKAAQKYPDTFFVHVSGYKRAPNMATMMADFYQIYYLNGLMAGALTKSGKVGYVGAHPIPEVVRHINAFTIGV